MNNTSKENSLNTYLPCLTTQSMRYVLSAVWDNHCKYLVILIHIPAEYWNIFSPKISTSSQSLGLFVYQDRSEELWEHHWLTVDKFTNSRAKQWLAQTGLLFRDTFYWPRVYNRKPIMQLTKLRISFLLVENFHILNTKCIPNTQRKMTRKQPEV